MRTIVISVLKGAGKLLLLLAVLCAAALPAVFLNTIYGYLPILLLAVLLILSRLSLEVLCRKTALSGGLGDVHCERGSSVTVQLSLTNRSRLFCPKARTTLIISDLFGERDAARVIPFAMAGRETVQFGFDLDMPHIGQYTVGLSQLELYDFFGVFKRRIPLKGQFSALITPCIRSIDELPVLDEVLAESPVETRAAVVGGTDSTGVREYALGDPMKQIHWKLSSHSREYLTKLHESSRQQEFAVILDFAAGKATDRELLMDLNDCLIETALSLINALAESDGGSTCSLLYCGRDGTVVRSAASSREGDMELIRSFSVITPNPDSAYPDARQILQRESRNANRSSNTVVVTSRVTPELLHELQQVKRQRRSPELYYIVPAAWNSRQLEQAQASLRDLDGMSIPYHLVSTAVNWKEGKGA